MRKYKSFDIPPDIMKLSVVKKGRKANLNGRFVDLAESHEVSISSPLNYRNLRFFRHEGKNPFNIIDVQDLSQKEIREIYDREKAQAKKYYRAAVCGQNQAKVMSAISASFGVAAVTFVGVSVVKGFPLLYQQFCEAAKTQTMIEVGCTATDYLQPSNDLRVGASLNALEAILLGVAALATLKGKNKVARNATANFVRAALALGSMEVCKKSMSEKEDATTDLDVRSYEPS